MRVIVEAERRGSAPTGCNPEGRRSLAPGGHRPEPVEGRAPLAMSRLAARRAPTLAPKIAVAARDPVRNSQLPWRAVGSTFRRVRPSRELVPFVRSWADMHVHRLRG